MIGDAEEGVIWEKMILSIDNVIKLNSEVGPNKISITLWILVITSNNANKIASKR